jgi:uncharacterized peroxidase-related enzyme
MPFLDLPVGLPGIIGLLTAYPATRKPLNDLANALLVGPSSLSRAERELIATYVSSRNECTFCTNSHAEAARSLLGDAQGLVDEILQFGAQAQISPRMKSLLVIADKVRQDGKLVTAEDVLHARACGADDQAIHDTVLITGLFGMFNRYVDGLRTALPDDPDAYREIGDRIAQHGYGSRYRD